MPTDTTGQSGRDPRRPVILDLPAEEVGRQPGEPQAQEPVDPPSAAAEQAEAAAERAEPAEASVGQAVDPTAEPPAGPDGPALSDEARDEEAMAAEAASRAAAERVAPAAPPPARPGASFGSLLAAAVLGGAISAGGLYALDRSGALPQSFFGGGAGDGGDIAVEIARLDAEIAELRETEGAAAAPDIEPLREQVANLEQVLAELREGLAAAPPDAAALQELQDRVARLEEAAGAPLAAGPGGAAPDPAIEERLTDLAGRLDALQAAASRPDPAPELATLRQRLDEVAGRIEAVEARPPVDLSGLETAVAELRQRADELSARLDAAPAEQRVAALETGLAEARRQAELSAALGPAVAADGLAAAVESGSPFTAELAALRALGFDEAALAALDPHAQSGLPTLAALRSDFEARVADINIAVPLPAGAGPLERLMESAKGLVEVRPADPVAGADPAAVLARIRAALEAGDLRRALTEWGALPETIKAPTADWARLVEARAAADELVVRLRSEALSRLGQQG